MNRAGWIELTVVAVVTALSWPGRKFFPSAMPLWQIMLGLSALLLAQSLVRDVALLLRRRHAARNGPRREAQCACLESTIGASGIVAGAALIGLGSAQPIGISRWSFSLAVAGTMILGFLIKDLVISWKPFGVRREPDHLNLIVRWRRKTN